MYSVKSQDDATWQRKTQNLQVLNSSATGRNTAAGSQKYQNAGSTQHPPTALQWRSAVLRHDCLPLCSSHWCAVCALCRGRDGNSQFLSPTEVQSGAEWEKRVGQLLSHHPLIAIHHFKLKAEWKFYVQKENKNRPAIRPAEEETLR